MDPRDEVLPWITRLCGGMAGVQKLHTLHVAQNKGRFEGWRFVELPEWAKDVAPEGYKGLLVPLWGDAMGAEWSDYDWWRAAHFMMTSQFERRYEARHGPVHSYASHYDRDEQALFDYAWVNRIILFLRRWWAVSNEADEDQAFGPIPKPVIHLTHDVDAVAKTLPIRVKQGAFWMYNRSFFRAVCFLLTPANYWQFETITRMEEAYGFRSTWNFYGGIGGWKRRPKYILFDPSYDITADRLSQHIRDMHGRGHRIGLHQSFDAWQDEAAMEEEKRRVEQALGAAVTTCRQHWLRFSFDTTWAAQAKAGLQIDMTLGFNDRPGFRNSAALSFQDAKSAMKIVPMVLMDSHLYDYASLTQEQQDETMDHILKELHQTGGEASIIWHQRVFHPDYGWGDGYARFLKRIHQMGFDVA